VGAGGGGARRRARWEAAGVGGFWAWGRWDFFSLRFGAGNRGRSGQFAMGE
jgi:hypothetical protein